MQVQTRDAWEQYRIKGEVPASGSPAWQEIAWPLGWALRDGPLPTAGVKTRVRSQVDRRYVLHALDWLELEGYVGRTLTAKGPMWALSGAGRAWLEAHPTTARAHAREARGASR